VAANYHKPQIAFRVAKESYFVHNSTAYAVADAPTPIFKAAVLAKEPHWRHSDIYRSILAQDELDIADRWYLLCGLRTSCHEIALYDSEEAAIRRNMSETPG
jgi:hypothetical protein